MRKTKKMVKLNGNGTLEHRSERYFQNALNVANELRNPYHKARLTYGVIRGAPEKSFDVQVKQKPRTRWFTCLLGLGFAASMYANGLFYEQNKQLQQQVARVQAEAGEEIGWYQQGFQKFRDDNSRLEHELNLESERAEGLQTAVNELQNLLRDTGRELEATLESYDTFLDVMTKRNLRGNDFVRRASFDSLVYEYAEHMGMQNDERFQRLLYEQMKEAILPGDGKTQQQTLQGWNQHPTTLQYYLRKSKGVKP